MGEAKRRAETGGLPRRMYAIVFNDKHRLAGQVVRYGREACIYFSSEEAVTQQRVFEAGDHFAENTTQIVPIMVKAIAGMLKK